MPALLHPGQHLTTASGRPLLVREWHGEGSYARLYRGELHGQPAGDCAVKVAKREIDGAVGFLERERDALSRGPFANVVELLDAGSAGAPFLVLSWLDGASLRDLICRRRQLPLAQALRLFRDAAGGVAALHRAGVAHADLRPDNVLVLERDSQARLLDLGSAVLRADPAFPAATHQDVERLGELLHLMLVGAAATPGPSRLTAAAGHHPHAVALYEAARTPGTHPDELARQTNVLLGRIGVSAGAATPRLR